MKNIFDHLRKISGGTLTQKQVDAADRLIVLSVNDVAAMLGVSTEDTLQISASGIALICSFEGLELKAYDDGVGVWTIGYGTTVYPNGTGVKKGDTCTLEQAKAYMSNDLKRFERTVNSVVTAPINQNQYDSLVSLTYNIGQKAFCDSTLCVAGFGESSGKRTEVV